MSVPAPPSAIDAQVALVRSLLDPACHPHPVSALKLLETHSSHAILTGTYAYKIKKPHNLGFLDFTGQRRRKLTPKKTNPSEAGEEVLDRQLAEREPLTAEERDVTVTINTEAPPAPKLIADRLASLAASY